MERNKLRFIIKWLICLGALLVARACFPAHFHLYGGLITLAGAATVLWLANLAVRPVLQILALPITLLTFGIFSLIVNAGMVSLTDLLIPAIRLRGFGVCLFTAVIISIGNGFFGAKSRRRE